MMNVTLPVVPASEIRAGTYRGSSDGLVVEIRVERGRQGELLRVGGDVLRDDLFIASFTADEAVERGSQAIVARLRFFGHTELSTGALQLDADARGVGAFQISVDLEGGHRDVVAGPVEWLGSFLRRLEIEIDGLEGTEPPPPFRDVSGLETTLKSAYENAGFQVSVRVDPFVSRPSEAIHMRGWSLAELHAAMEQTRGPRKPDRLSVHVFVASFMKDNPGVLGVMYDFDSDDLNNTPREGVAIFHDHPMLSDPHFSEAVRRREYVFTCVHEVGHALNLLHSFDKGRPAALSWMNYPDLYPRGLEAGNGHDGSDEFWRRFRLGFDDEELLHLGFAALNEIRPGGLPFGVYEEGPSTIYVGGQATPRRTRLGANPFRAISTVELVLSTHKRAYELGEPIFAELGLRNVGNTTLLVPRRLDPSDGFVTLHVRKPSGELIRLRPPVQLCQETMYQRLEPGGRTRSFDHVPIFLDKSGPVFTEPGTYEVRADMTGIDGGRVAFAKPWRIEVMVPDRATDRVARAVFERSDFLRALYLRHPLSSYEGWKDLEQTLALASQNLTPGHTLPAYMDYVAARGWSEEFAQRRNVPRPQDLQKAKERIARVPADQLLALPGAVTRLRQQLESLPDPSAKQVFELRPDKPQARLPPSGLFGELGLSFDERAHSEQPRSPFARVVTKLAGTRKFADVVSWNIEHLHSQLHKIPRVADLIRGFRCDVWGLQEVDAKALAALVAELNASGRTQYDFRVVAGQGQQCGLLFRTDTTTVQVLPTPERLSSVDELEVELRAGGTAQRSVFFRNPLLCDVRVRQESKVFDFRTAVVHLKSTDTKLRDTGNALRTEAARRLGQWIRSDRAASAERDYLIMGDMNAETATQGLAPFTRGSLKLLSVGMVDRHGEDQALTRVASGRFLDHIVVTKDATTRMPAEDQDEQIIIRADLSFGDFGEDFSDHVPVAARFALGKDLD